MFIVVFLHGREESSYPPFLGASWKCQCQKSDIISIVIAVLQLHPFEDQATVVQCCSNIDGGIGVFWGGKSSWLFRSLFSLTGTEDDSIQ